MIKNTFTFIPGVGETVEQELWKKGIFTWEDLKRKPSLIGVDKTRRKVINHYLSQAKSSLEKRDISFLPKIYRKKIIGGYTRNLKKRWYF